MSVGAQGRLEARGGVGAPLPALHVFSATICGQFSGGLPTK